MWDPYAGFEHTILPNGLSVYAAHWPERPWEAVGFLIHSGAEHDPVGLEGLAHFVEHMVCNNTVASEDAINMFFDNCGGTVDLGSTGYPSSAYRFFMPSEERLLAEAFVIFGHMLISAILENFIERERQVIISEFSRKYAMRFKLNLDIRKNRALYKDYWLERFVSPLGSPQSVKRITRNHLQSYYDAHYAPANISVVGIGGIEPARLVRLLSESPFAASKPRTRMPLPTRTDDVASPTETRYVVKTSDHLRMEHPLRVGAYLSSAKIPGIVNPCAVSLFSNMLSEVLNEQIRTRRAWTYNVHSSQIYLRHFYEFSIACDTFDISAIDEFEDAVENCLAQVRHREDLFERIKRRRLASSLLYDATGKEICDSALDDLAKYQRIATIAEFKNLMECVTMSDIRDLLRWLAPERRWTLIMRP